MSREQERPRPFSKYWFLLYADELYVLTRFAYFAFLQNVAFRNAHHTLEYYYKAGLAESIPLGKLKHLEHNLKKLHRMFVKKVSPLSINNEEIDYLDNFNSLRYPKDNSFTSIGWGLPLTDFFSRFDGNARNRVACFNINDIDRIVYDIRNSVVPPSFSMSVVAEEHAAFLYRDNHFFHPTQE